MEKISKNIEENVIENINNKKSNKIKENSGYVSLVLHAHLPFIYHPEDDSFLEENWLYEAISETYIPLLKAFNKLVEENINFRITMTLTPSLLNMLDNNLLKKRYIEYLISKIELASKEIIRTSSLSLEEQNLAKYYYDRYSEDLNFFSNKLNCDLISEFKRFQDLGYLEIITCGATHGFFPILILNEKAVRAQIKVGVDCYKKYFKKNPNGIWLPECGYVPEVDKYLKEFKIKYIITETHGILYADPTPIYKTAAPIVSKEGIIAFGRDLKSSRQVWSSISGYPGDYNYRDFYEDIGYTLDYEYIKPYISKNGIRVHTGLKYYRITGKNVKKELYNVEKACRVAEMQAEHFFKSFEKQINDLKDYTLNPPIILSPYDAELYGHWWYEGPYFLYILFKKIHYSNVFSLITPSEYIEKFPIMQVSTPCRSTWGHNGYNEVWINHSNDYAHKHLIHLADKMVKIANIFKDKTKCNTIQIRALNQLSRELLLLQSSDWLFIITNNTMTDYAHRRIKEHTNRFNILYDQIMNNNINEEFLKDIELKDDIFKEIDYTMYV